MDWLLWSCFSLLLWKFWGVIGCQEFNCVCKSAPGGRHKETPFYQQQQSLLAHKLIGFLGHQHSKDGNSSSSSKTNCLLKGLKWNNYSYTCSHIKKLLLYKIWLPLIWFNETFILDWKKCYKNDNILRIKSKNENPKNKPKFPPTLPTKPANV